MGNNRVHDAFLAGQTQELKELAANSIVFDLDAVVGTLFHLTFHCKGLVINKQGDIEENDEFKVVLNVPPDYLRKPIDDPSLMIAMVNNNTFHPNIMGHIICVGKINASTPLAYLVNQIYEILTYQKFNPLEFDALNHKACEWSRQHQDRFPIDDRKLLQQ